MDTITNMSEITGSNQPEMTRDEAIRLAKRKAREAGRDVAAGRMSYTQYVGVLIPLASLDANDATKKPLIIAEDAGDLWGEWRGAEQGALSNAYADADNDDGNGAAANTSKLKQVLKLANVTHYAEELLQETLDAIAHFKGLRDKDIKTKSPYPAFVDVCRAQLKTPDVRLSADEINHIVLVHKKNPDELKKLKQALKLLEAAEKLRDPSGTTANPDITQAQARVGERIATIEREAEMELLRQQAAKLGASVV
jgi:hypothetical protein